MKSIAPGRLPFEDKEWCAQYFSDLRLGVQNFITYQREVSIADDKKREFLGLEPPVEPAPYQLLKKLRLFQGGGNLPFPNPGGYWDQPAWLMKCLEICMEIERDMPAAQQPMTQGPDDISALLQLAEKALE